MAWDERHANSIAAAALMTEVQAIEENLEELEPTGMDGGVQPNGSSSRKDNEASEHQNWGENGPALRRLPCNIPVYPQQHPLPDSGSEWVEDKAQQRQAADRSRIKPSLEHDGALVAKMGVAWPFWRKRVRWGGSLAENSGVCEWLQERLSLPSPAHDELRLTAKAARHLAATPATASHVTKP